MARRSRLGWGRWAFLLAARRRGRRSGKPTFLPGNRVLGRNQRSCQARPTRSTSGKVGRMVWPRGGKSMPTHSCGQCGHADPNAQPYFSNCGARRSLPTESGPSREITTGPRVAPSGTTNIWNRRHLVSRKVRLVLPVALWVVAYLTSLALGAKATRCSWRSCLPLISPFSCC